MRERPILFSGAMVKAILDGRKTQTRRIVRGVFEHIYADGVRRDSLMEWDGMPTPLPGPYEKTPFGGAGTTLWVRETFHNPCEDNRDHDLVLFRADGAVLSSDLGKWTPSIHMPRWASRLTLEVQAVRVERVQEISEEDVIAEGFLRDTSPPHDGTRLNALGRESVFAGIWDALNAKRGVGWSANPWVWAVTFKRVMASAEARA